MAITKADKPKRKYRERRKSARLYEVEKGEMVAVLTTLPKRLKTIGEILLNGERLNHADKSYLSRQRAKLMEDYSYQVGDNEAERIRRLWEQGLPKCKIAKILGRSHTTISWYLKKMRLL